MTNRNLPPTKSKKGLIIGIAIGVFLLILFLIIAVIAGAVYWHWTINVNS